jgi:23S rRNA pseudouridine955/2504/2580 synthase/23S rRNA pseudouridine1911/1915/1917 synthase
MKSEITAIYQDENIMVVNKPSGILVIPPQDMFENSANSLASSLKKQFRIKFWAIHTIDKEASGVIVFAKNEKTYKDISAQFGKEQVCKKYAALISGNFRECDGTIEKSILVSKTKSSISAKGKKTVTKFKVLEKFRQYSLIEIETYNSIRKQIRLHLQSEGHPILIDGEYGSSEPLFLSSFKRNYKPKTSEQEKPLISRLALHLQELSFNLYSKKEKFIAHLPKDFQVTLKQLKKYAKAFER